MVRPVNLQNVELPGMRGRIAALVESPKFINFIAGLIVLNAIILGLETYPEIRLFYGGVLHFFDVFILAVFVLEMALKLYLYRLSFFRAGWNVFDFLIVSISLVPAGDALTVLRAFRIFRILRLMSIVPQMRRVISALLLSIPGMASIVGILFIIFYVSSVLATQLFGTHGDPMMQELFGSIGASMYSLFQVMTLEGWSENIAKPVMNIFPWAWMFFIPFIIVTSFAVLNLFIGIIVDAMNIVKGEDLEEEGAEIMAKAHDETVVLQKEISALRRDMKEIKSLLKKAA